MATKAKSRSKPKPPVFDEETPFNEKVEQIADYVREKYEAWSLEDLATAWQDAQKKVRELQEAIELADTALSDAALKDANELAESMEHDLDASIEAKHTNKERERTARLYPQRWRAMKMMNEYELTYRIRATAEKQAEAAELRPQLEKKRQKLRELEQEVNQLQGRVSELSHIARETQPKKQLFGQFEALAAGPDLSGMRRFLYGS